MELLPPTERTISGFGRCNLSFLWNATFGTLGFYVDYDELFEKQWDQLTLDGAWLNTPNSFRDHYIAYRKDDANLNLSPKLYFQTLYYPYNASTKKYDLPTGTSEIKVFNSGNNNIYVTGDDYFTAKVSIFDEVLTPIDNAFELFERTGSIFWNAFNRSKLGLPHHWKRPIEIFVEPVVLHSLYPKVYALALMNEGRYGTAQWALYFFAWKPRTFLPSPPRVEHDRRVPKYGLKQHSVISPPPFGQAENQETLLPTYCKGGELYIGFENAEPLQQINLLSFPILEGTEKSIGLRLSRQNISGLLLAITFLGRIGTATIFLGNTTDNFSENRSRYRSHPEGATNHNTLLPSGFMLSCANR